MSDVEQDDGEDQELPDDSEPSPERQTELEKAYEANIAAGNPPYKGVRIRTRGELRWVMEKRQWFGGAFAGFQDANYVISVARPDLRGINLEDVHLPRIALARADLSGARLLHANLAGAHLLDADLSHADLQAANLQSARLQNANLTGALAMDANFSGAWLTAVDLAATNLRRARFDIDTALIGIHLDEWTQVADVLWNGVPLSQIEWRQIRELGDEHLARFPAPSTPAALKNCVEAARANRQLATALRSQGMADEADDFAYRARQMQRLVLRHQVFMQETEFHINPWYRLRKLMAYLGSGLLDLIAGYGYRPGRSLLAYIFIILTFAGLYLLNGQFAAPHLHWDEAVVLSVSSFHGRGFFTTDTHLGDTLARLAAAEAIVGLLVEITFIATFTQRFLSR